MKKHIPLFGNAFTKQLRQLDRRFLDLERSPIEVTTKLTSVINEASRTPRPATIPVFTTPISVLTSQFIAPIFVGIYQYNITTSTGADPEKWFRSNDNGLTWIEFSGPSNTGGTGPHGSESGNNEIVTVIEDIINELSSFSLWRLNLTTNIWTKDTGLPDAASLYRLSNVYNSVGELFAYSTDISPGLFGLYRYQTSWIFVDDIAEAALSNLRASNNVIIARDNAFDLRLSLDSGVSFSLLQPFSGHHSAGISVDSTRLFAVRIQSPNIFIRISDNNGVSWTDKVTIPWNSAVSTPFNAIKSNTNFPNLVVAILYIDGHFLVVISKDKGDSWITHQFDVTLASGTWHDALTISSSGAISFGYSGTGNSLKVITSPDFGDTWSDPVEIYQGPSPSDYVVSASIVAA